MTDNGSVSPTAAFISNDLQFWQRTESGGGAVLELHRMQIQIGEDDADNLPALAEAQRASKRPRIKRGTKWAFSHP
jgi:hypothetical protein